MPTVEDPRPSADLVSSAGLDLLPTPLAADLERSLRTALAARAIFPDGRDPLGIFRAALSDSIRDIERHERGRLIQRFLLQGPYEDVGDIPPEKAALRLADAEVAATIAFIHSFMVNSFKGSLVELLACESCLRFVRDLQEQGRLPPDARLYVGDSVLAATSKGSRLAKGADLHLLEIEEGAAAPRAVRVLGVFEVKSYPLSQRRVRQQLARHLDRAVRGLRIGGRTVPPSSIRLRRQAKREPVRVAVVPSSWRLPRGFAIAKSTGGHVIHTQHAGAPTTEDRIVRIAPSEWRITLRWSQEAISSAAFAMTFWYMEKVGEVIYRAGVPQDWSEMTPAEAGKNAVKMMLYYSILRTRTQAEEQRAIALYNTYSFGYALGMSFRNAEKRRKMLWLEDLQEIDANGETASGCRLR